MAISCSRQLDVHVVVLILSSRSWVEKAFRLEGKTTSGDKTDLYLYFIQNSSVKCCNNDNNSDKTFHTNNRLDRDKFVEKK